MNPTSRRSSTFQIISVAELLAEPDVDRRPRCAAPGCDRLAKELAFRYDSTEAASAYCAAHGDCADYWIPIYGRDGLEGDLVDWLDHLASKAELLGQLLAWLASEGGQVVLELAAAWQHQRIAADRRRDEALRSVRIRLAPPAKHYRVGPPAPRFRIRPRARR